MLTRLIFLSNSRLFNKICIALLLGNWHICNINFITARSLKALRLLFRVTYVKKIQEQISYINHKI